MKKQAWTKRTNWNGLILITGTVLIIIAFINGKYDSGAVCLLFGIASLAYFSGECIKVKKRKRKELLQQKVEP